ncbi:MAG TPA: hypothetical protein VJZ93_02040 [Candidatus Nanoarchaeia archaeon]|nr:hypothetical protein [Candidatus Nanoarchaeia archaeon]
METKKISDKEIRKIVEDMALIKEILFYNSNIKDSEGEFSDWAKIELEKARKEFLMKTLKKN